jgi:hypothetical protein
LPVVPKDELMTLQLPVGCVAMKLRREKRGMVIKKDQGRIPEIFDP